MVANESKGNPILKTKGLKRRGGLSKYYASKSVSFSNLELALTFDSASSLGKATSTTGGMIATTSRQDSEELNGIFGGRHSCPSVSSDTDLSCCLSADAMADDVSELFLLALQIDKTSGPAEPMARFQPGRWHRSPLRENSIGRMPSLQQVSTSTALVAITELSSVGLPVFDGPPSQSP